MAQDVRDVVIVGYGPTGQLLSALLGQDGHDVAAFERHLSLYALPRASSLDHELARTLQRLGVMDRYLEVSAEPASKYHWINGGGQRLMSIDWGRPQIDGFYNMYIGFQPRLEDCLCDAARASGNVEVSRGWDVVAVRDRADGLVDVEALENVVGADGRRSPSGRYPLLLNLNG